MSTRDHSTRPTAPDSPARPVVAALRVAASGAAIVLAWAVAAILAPAIAPYPPNAVHVSIRLLAPPPNTCWAPMSRTRRVLATAVRRAHLPDDGRRRGRLGALVGTLIGGIAAYAAAGREEALMRLTDLVLCFPPIILAMAIAAALGIGTTNTIIAMLVVWWPKFARLARSLVLQQRALEYVEAALVARLSDLRTSCCATSFRMP